MKTVSLYACIWVVALGFFSACGNGGNGDPVKNADSTMNVDSANAAHHTDPAGAFPQPPVTGSIQDSSRIKDSAKKH